MVFFSSIFPIFKKKRVLVLATENFLYFLKWPNVFRLVPVISSSSSSPLSSSLLALSALLSASSSLLSLLWETCPFRSRLSPSIKGWRFSLFFSLDRSHVKSHSHRLRFKDYDYFWITQITDYSFNYCWTYSRSYSCSYFVQVYFFIESTTVNRSKLNIWVLFLHCYLSPLKQVF